MTEMDLTLRSTRWPATLVPGIYLVGAKMRGLPLPPYLIHLRTIIDTDARHAPVDGFRQRGEDRTRRKHH